METLPKPVDGSEKNNEIRYVNGSTEKPNISITRKYRAEIIKREYRTNCIIIFNSVTMDTSSITVDC